MGEIPLDELAKAELVLDVPAVELLNLSLGESLPVRLPYLFFKYLAHELRAAPSLSPPVLRSGELSRDFKACVDLLRDSSLDCDDKDDVPYLKLKCEV